MFISRSTQSSAVRVGMVGVQGVLCCTHLLHHHFSPSQDTLKISYDLKSEGASAEWAHKPLKVTLSSTVSKKLQVGAEFHSVSKSHSFV